MRTMKKIAFLCTCIVTTGVIDASTRQPFTKWEKKQESLKSSGNAAKRILLGAIYDVDNPEILPLPQATSSIILEKVDNSSPRSTVNKRKRKNRRHRDDETIGPKKRTKKQKKQTWKQEKFKPNDRSKSRKKRKMINSYIAQKKHEREMQLLEKQKEEKEKIRQEYVSKFDGNNGYNGRGDFSEDLGNYDY